MPRRASNRAFDTDFEHEWQGCPEPSEEFHVRHVIRVVQSSFCSDNRGVPSALQSVILASCTPERIPRTETIDEQIVTVQLNVSGGNRKRSSLARKGQQGQKRCKKCSESFFHAAPFRSKSQAAKSMARNAPLDSGFINEMPGSWTDSQNEDTSGISA